MKCLRRRSWRLGGIALLAGSLVGGCGSPPRPSRSGTGENLTHSGVFSNRYGPALVKEGRYSAHSELRPWSGYWYPLSRIDARSALQKYDQVTGRQALAWEESRLTQALDRFNPWEGRCDAWAFASILRPEPRVPQVVQSNATEVVFSVAEQKALWIFAHERIDARDRWVVGERNDGDGSSSFDDLAPSEFHRILQVLLEQEHRPFVMDRDPRPPVWNTPVYGANWEVKPRPGSEGIFDVSVWVQAVFPYDEDIESTERIAPVLHYQYELFTVSTSEGALVLDGKWTGASRRDHPDFVTVLSDSALGPRGSTNPEIDLQWLETHL